VAGLRNFQEFTRSLWDEWTNEVPQDVLLIGPNGSGKTTLLEVVATLWESLAEWARLKRAPRLPDTHLLARCRLAAVEIEGFALPDEQGRLFGEAASLWLVVGEDAEYQRLRQEYPQSVYVGCIRRGRGQGSGKPRLEHPGDAWLHGLDLALQDLRLGNGGGLSSMVFLESETRRLLSPRGKPDVYPDPPSFRWLARYEATDRWQSHLESALRNLKLSDEATFATMLATLDGLLRGKRIERFDPQSLRLMVDIEGGGTHTLDELSSGERQCLIMLFMVSRWLRSGAVVLVDEPDLHLHRSLLHGFMGFLRKVVKERDGQLIIASHSTHLWQEYTRPSQRVELGEMAEVVE
jgi:ABC-type lipoprotein export system ATPase subunit